MSTRRSEGFLSHFACCTVRLKGGDSPMSCSAGGFPFTQTNQSGFESIPKLDPKQSEGLEILLAYADSNHPCHCVWGSRDTTPAGKYFTADLAAPPDANHLFPCLKYIPPSSQPDSPHRVLGVYTTATSNSSSACVWQLNDFAEPIIFPIDPSLGVVTCVSAGSAPNFALVCGTTGGFVLHISSSGVVSGSHQTGSPVESVYYDGDFVYAALSSSKIIVLSEFFANISTIPLPASVGSISHLLRPGRRSVVTGKPPLVGTLFFAAGGSQIGQINLGSAELVSTATLPVGETVAQLKFGPFDNGPLLTVTSENRVVVWETGSCMRISSDFPQRGFQRIHDLSPVAGQESLLLLTASTNNVLSVCTLSLRNSIIRR